MNTKTIKTYIKQLVKQLGTKEAVSIKLGITLRYVYMLEKGERVPSEHLRKLIKLILKETP